MEGCEIRKKVEKEELEEWGTRHSRDRKKKKGDVGAEKAEEEEGEKMEFFFCELHKFLTDYTSFLGNPFVPPVVIPVPFVPVVFVPAALSLPSSLSTTSRSST